MSRKRNRCQRQLLNRNHDHDPIQHFRVCLVALSDTSSIPPKPLPQLRRTDGISPRQLVPWRGSLVGNCPGNLGCSIAGAYVRYLSGATYGKVVTQPVYAIQILGRHQELYPCLSQHCTHNTARQKLPHTFSWRAFSTTYFARSESCCAT